MKKLLKLLAVALAIIMVFQVVQVGILAAPIPVQRSVSGGDANFPDDIALDRDEIEDDEHASLIIGELPELREESVRHFRREDGLYVAVMYSQPVHVLSEDGTWEDIDATFLFEENEDGELVLAAQALPNPVSLPQSFADGQGTIEVGEHTISFGVSAFNALLEPETEYEPEPELEVEAEYPDEDEVETDNPAIDEDATEYYTQQDAEEPTQEEPSTSTEVFEVESEEVLQVPMHASRLEPVLQEEISVDARPSVNLEQEAQIIAVEDAVSFVEDEEAITQPVDCEIEQIHQANAEFVSVEPSISAVIYENVFDGADLEYIITPTGVQENIVVREQREQYIFFFDMDFGGLIPVPQEDGSIVLFHPESHEFAAILPAPHMMDQNGEMSGAVTMELATWEDQFVMTVTANADWVNAEERAWPVVVAQSVNLTPPRMTLTYGPNGNFIGRDGNIISWAHLTFPLPTLPTGATVSSARLETHVTNPSAYGVPGVRVYAGIIHPLTTEQRRLFVSDSWFISHAGNVGTFNVNRRINMTNAAMYWYSGIAPSHAAITISMSGVESTLIRRGHVTLNESITHFSVSYTNNVGLQGHWSYETINLGRSGQVHINRVNGLLTFVHPMLQLEGNRMPFGFQQVFTTQRSFAPRLRNALGGGFFADSGLSDAAKPVPALMSFMEHIEPLHTLSAYRLTDGTGVTHYFFRQDDGGYVHQFDEHLVLGVSESRETVTITDGQGNIRRFHNGMLHEMEDANGNITTIHLGGLEMVDGSGNVLTFDLSELMNSWFPSAPPVSDLNQLMMAFMQWLFEKAIGLGMQRIYNYEGVIRSITDAVGREIVFEYAFEEPILFPPNNPMVVAHAFPTHMSAVVAPDGQRIEFSYELDDESQTNHSNGWLHMDYHDGRRTSLRFSGNEFNGFVSGRRIDAIHVADGSVISFSYESDVLGLPQFQRVNGVERRGNGELLHALDFDWSNTGTMTVSDVTIPEEPQVQSYVFDYWGRLVNSWNEDMVATYVQYSFEGNDPSLATAVSAAQPMIHNLIRNHSFEMDTADWMMLSTSQDAGTAKIVDDAAFSGTYALLVENENQAESIAAVQIINSSSTQSPSLEPGLYTLSAYVLLPENLDVIVNGGARLSLIASRTTGGLFTSDIEVSSQHITLANEWTRHDVTIEIPANWSNFRLQARLEVDQAEGIALFDAVQLEPGGSVNDYNLLENSQFREGLSQRPRGWVGENLLLWGPDSVQEGRMRITGQENQSKSLSQVVRVNAQAGQTIVFNSFAQAINANLEGRFGVALSADTGETAFASFSLTTQGVQMTGGALRLTEDAEFVTLSLIYDNQSGAAYFGGAALYVGNFGESFEYLDSGLLRSIRNDFGSSIQFEYDSNNNPTRILQMQDDEILQELGLEFDANRNIIRQETAGITTYFYYGGTRDGSTTYGVVTEVVSITENGYTTRESMTFTDCFNFLTSYTDARGMTSTFEYCLLSGRLLTATDPNGNTVTYSFEFVEIDGQVVEQKIITGQAEPGGPPSVTSFSSTEGLLQEITRSGDISYHMEHDALGRVVEVGVGGNWLIRNSFDQRQRLARQYFANGHTYSVEYDHMGRLISETFNNGLSGQPNFSYTYNLKNQLTRIIDRENNVTWNYGFDVSGQLVSLVGTDGTQARYAYDPITNTLNRLTVSQNGAIISDVSYYYTEDGRPTEVLLHSMGGAAVSYDFDTLNRLRRSVLDVPSTFSLERNYGYLGTQDNASELIEQLQVQLQDEDGIATTLRSYTVTYDDLGNISTITDIYGNIVRYSYDGLNRLVREDNELINHSFRFTYDDRGNIVQVSLHEFSLEDTLSPALQTSDYAFENPSWPDQLTSHNGNEITYDAMGNPLTYNGYTFIWQKGRQLAGITGNGLNISFRYNADGRRTQKIVDGVTTYYTWIDGLLMRRQTGDEVLNFAYDANGRAIGFSFAGNHYFYIYNLLGDVVAILDELGNVVAEYAYDAYGNILRQYGPMAQINPIRYRGYYFDNETGFYYLHTRFYNPHWGRFLNADSYLIAGNALTASNLYAYANGNPIMFVDPSGEFAVIRRVAQAATTVVNAVANSTIGSAAIGVASTVLNSTPVTTVTNVVSRIRNPSPAQATTTSLGTSIVGTVVGGLMSLVSSVSTAVNFIQNGPSDEFRNSTLGNAIDLGLRAAVVITAGVTALAIVADAVFDNVATNTFVAGASLSLRTADAALTWFRGTPTPGPDDPGTGGPGTGTGPGVITLARQREEDVLMRDYARSLVLSPPEWQDKNDAQREAHLTYIFNRVRANKRITTAITFDIVPLPAHVVGRFFPEERIIEINRNRLHNALEMQRVVIHELRHVYQTEAVNGIGNHVVTAETRHAWWTNQLPNYIRIGQILPDGTVVTEAMYLAQPIEFDAFMFANQLESNILAGDYVLSEGDIAPRHIGSWQQEWSVLVQLNMA